MLTDWIYKRKRFYFQVYRKEFFIKKSPCFKTTLSELSLIISLLLAEEINDRINHHIIENLLKTFIYFQSILEICGNFGTDNIQLSAKKRHYHICFHSN